MYESCSRSSETSKLGDLSMWLVQDSSMSWPCSTPRPRHWGLPCERIGTFRFIRLLNVSYVDLVCMHLNIADERQPSDTLSWYCCVLCPRRQGSSTNICPSTISITLLCCNRASSGSVIFAGVWEQEGLALQIPPASRTTNIFADDLVTQPRQSAGSRRMPESGVLRDGQVGSVMPMLLYSTSVSQPMVILVSLL